MNFRVLAVAAVVTTAGVVGCGSDKTTKLPTAATACVPATESDFANSAFTGVPACSSQMYAKYQDAGFKAVNSAIGKLALSADTSKLGDSFQTKIAAADANRQAEFSAHLLQFLEAAYGSTTPYTGPTMTASHAKLEITRAQYDYFLTDVVVPALKSVITDPNNQTDIGACFAPVLMDPNVIKTVVTCKG